MHRSRSETLNRTLGEWDLLRHPFYQAWNEGTLPAATLARYASEYGNYIRAIPDAWRAAGEGAIAGIEAEHADLWDEFTRSLGAPVRAPSVASVSALCSGITASAASPARALGALYAFEAQQADVARSKRDGLKRHYRGANPALSVRYFDAHVDDDGEPALLDARIAALDEAGRREAHEAAASTARALWAALDGILEAETGAVAAG